MSEQTNKLMNTTMNRWRMAAALFALGGITASTVSAADIAVKDGQKIAFMGDSITQAGAGPKGYVRLVISGLDANGVKATAIPAGISGHKSNQMLDRLDRDALNKKPDWMTLSCGVNDVWHGANGVPLDSLQGKHHQDRREVRDRRRQGDDPHLDHDRRGPAQCEQPKADALQQFSEGARQGKKCLLADLNGDMQAAIAKVGPEKKGNLLTGDGVHMNAAGNKMMAVGVLKAFGLSAEQITKAETAWSTPPAAK